MLIVPTVLHLADPAFGAETGSSNGYGTLPPSGYGVLPPGKGVHCQGECLPPQDSTPPSPATPSPVTPSGPAPTPTPTPAPTNGTGSSNTPPTPRPTNTTPPQPTPTTPGTGANTGTTTPTTPTPDETPEAPEVIDTLSSGLLVGFTPDVTVDLGLGDNGAIRGAADLGAVRAGETRTIVFNPPPPTQLLERTGLGEVTTESLRTVLSDPAVLGVRLTAGVDASDAQLTVRQFLPNEAPTDSVHVAPGTGVASVTISVGSGATAEAFKALQILEISAPGIPEGGVEGATVAFRVTQAQLDAMGLTTSDIRLLHLDGGKWVELETRLVSGPINGVYSFEADTPHFSYFAVAGAAPQETVSEKGTSALGTVGVLLAALVAVSIAAVALANRRQR